MKYVADHPAPPNKPRENWVDKVGGLPKPIDAVMRALMAKGWGQQRAVATAVNHVKKTCATGRAFGGKTEVSAEARATACRAVAEWESKKARARSMSVSRDQARSALVELSNAGIGRVTVERDTDPAVIELAANPGLVPVKVTVHRKNGTTFQRTMMVRPNQAKQMRSQKGGRQVSVKGLKASRHETRVLEEIAKIPKADRPAGWDRLVRAVASGPSHGGRLGPEKRRLLRDLQKNAPPGSSLEAAVTSALQSDAKAPSKQTRQKRRARRTAEKNAARPRPGKIVAGPPTQRPKA